MLAKDTGPKTEIRQVGVETTVDSDVSSLLRAH